MKLRDLPPPLPFRSALLSLSTGGLLALSQALAAPDAPAPTPAPTAPAAPAKPATPAPAKPAKPGTPAAAAQPPPALGPTQIVLQNGVSLPLSAVALKGENYEVKVETGRFEVGKTIPVTSVDHVFGDKPAAINQAIALVLTGKPVEGRKLLIPILAEHKDSAKLPGNFWLEAARVSLVANALEGVGPQCDSLGKEISAVSPVSPDPFVALSKALVMHKTVKLADRQAALKALVTDSQPADVCGYASYFLAGLLQSDKRDAEALEAYLAVPCLFPSGGMMLNGMAQLKAAEYLTSVDRRSEAVGLVQSALRYTKDTLGHDLANNLYQSIK